MATEEQTTYNNSTPLGYHITLQFARVGQKLTISNRYVTKLGFWLSKTGTPAGNVTFSIYKVSDGSLIVSKLLGTADSLTGSAVYYEVTFDTATYINEAVYIVAVDTNYDNSNYVNVSYQTTDVKASENFAQYYSGAWNSTYPTNDCAYIYTYYSGSTTAPAVTIQAMSSIAATTATGNGNVTVLGAPAATQHGHCWNTTGAPTTADSKTEKGVPAATGAFTSSLTGLTNGVKYYIRAYITNSAGTTYSNEIAFTAGVSGSGVSFPSDPVARVSSIRHFFRPSMFRMEASVGALGFGMEIAETSVRQELGLPPAPSASAPAPVSPAPAQPSPRDITIGPQPASENRLTIGPTDQPPQGGVQLTQYAKDILATPAGQAGLARQKGLQLQAKGYEVNVVTPYAIQALRKNEEAATTLIEIQRLTKAASTVSGGAAPMTGYARQVLIQKIIDLKAKYKTLISGGQ